MSDDSQQLQRHLAGLSAKRLARFIAELAQTDEAVANRVELLLVPDAAPDLAKKLRKRIAGLRQMRGFVEYREAFQFGGELDTLLEAVEDKLGEDHPATAVELLDEFLHTDAVVFEHADDSAGVIGQSYRRACELFATAAAKLKGSGDLPGRVAALLEKDAYGVRHDLLKHAARFLSADAIRALAEEWMQQAAAIPENSSGDTFSRNGILIKVEALAESIGDPELYERAAFFERDPKKFPVIALKVARQYLAAKRAAEAQEKLPPEAAVPNFRYDYEEILAGIFRQLGRKEELRALQWNVFCRQPCKPTADEYLKTLPAAERTQAVQRLHEQVQAGNYSPQQKALYFTVQKELGRAADYIVAHPAAFDGNQHSLLVPLAEALEKQHPLAASVLYRALVEAILARALSKYYHHAARYFRKLEKIAGRVEAWRAIEPHAAYVEAFRITHKRKTAFWSKLVGEKRGGDSRG